MQTPGLALGKGWSWDRAAGRTSCLLLQHGVVGEEGFRVMQQLAPNGGSAVSSVCAPQPLERGEEGYSGGSMILVMTERRVSLRALELLVGLGSSIMQVPGRRVMGLLMTPGGFQLLCGGKQEDVQWFLWCVASKEAEEELGLHPSSSLTCIVKKDNKNTKIYCNKLPTHGVSSVTKLSVGCGIWGSL